jgi:hypothetical protein
VVKERYERRVIGKATPSDRGIQMILTGSKSSELMREEIAHSLPIGMMNTPMAGYLSFKHLTTAEDKGGL